MTKLATCKIDASGLTAMIAIGMQYSKRTPAVAVNTAALVVARFAWSNMPVTALGRIDSDLSVESVPVLSSRGNRKGLPLRNGRRRITGVGSSAAGQFPQVPLAWLLISARAKSGSRYNVSTGDYWKLPQHPLKGRRITEFAGVMLAAVTRMISGRRSSTHFLQACWIPAIRQMEPFADPRIAGRRVAGPPGSADTIEGAGYARPAHEGETYAFAEIANDAGGAGRSIALNQKHNAALWELGAPVFQRAIDDEAMNIMRYTAEQRFQQDFRRLPASDFVINI